jgi:MFS family permease
MQPGTGPTTMRDAVWPVIPLLFGTALFMGATGLQGSLVALRGTVELFRAAEVGLISSAYFIGFVVGSRVSAAWIGRVGHVRAFAAFTAIASTLVLVHILAISVPVWMVVRLLSGMCVSGLVVIIESWLNGSTPSALRGRVLSIYMTANLGGYAAGQFLLLVAPVDSFELFVIVSVLLSAALVPVILSRRVNPPVVHPQSMPFLALVRRTPAGVTASAMAGLTWGAIGGYSAVVAAQAGLDGLQLTLFVSSFLVGHLLLEWVVGGLSDRLDRRVVLLLVSSAATGFAVTAAIMANGSVVVLLLLGVAIGGTTLPLYSLSIALTGDRLEPEEIVAASGTLVRTNGAGAATGPLLAALVTASELGVAGFYLLVAAGTTVVLALAAILLLRDGTLAPRVPYVHAVGRATEVVTRTMLRTAESVRERRPASRQPTSPGESPPVDDGHP